jgi:hypothetical protein
MSYQEKWFNAAVQRLPNVSVFTNDDNPIAIVTPNSFRLYNVITQEVVMEPGTAPQFIPWLHQFELCWLFVSLVI